MPNCFQTGNQQNQMEVSTQTFFSIIKTLRLYVFKQEEIEPPSADVAGIRGIPVEYIQRYLNGLIALSSRFQWNSSVVKLEKAINSDPVLRMNWQHSINKSQNLKGLSGKDVLNMLNVIINEAPSYDNSLMVGFPINSLFLHMMQNQNGRAVFGNYKFNEAMREVLNDYGSMLLSPRSLTYMNALSPKGWLCPEAQQKIDYSLYQVALEDPHYGFKNWNQWFLRKFKPGVRVVENNNLQDVAEEDIIIHSCQATPISEPQQPIMNVQAKAPFWLKGNKYSLVDMFGKEGSRKGYSRLFVGGSVLQSFLNALTYHRWHAPVDGQIIDVYKIPGTYYLDQSQFLEEFDPITQDKSQSFLAHTAARMVYILKADNPKIGYVGLIYIGMAECSGLESSKRKGEKVRKGEEMGHFLFGGSTYVMLLQPQAKLLFSKELYSLSGQGKEQPVLSYLASVH